MTLVLGALTERFAALASDRRLTDAFSGDIRDDDRNKRTQLGNFLAFGYTGIVDLEGQRTDMWLADKLQGDEPLSTRFQRVAEAAATAVAKVPSRRTKRATRS